MQSRITIYFLISLLLVLSGCKKNSEAFETKTFFSMGSYLSITIPEKDADKIEGVLKFIESKSAELKHDEESVSKAEVNKTIEVSNIFSDLYNKSLHYYDITGGKFDPTSITVSSLYGFPDRDRIIPDNNTLSKTKAIAGFKNISIKDNIVTKLTPLSIEFGANGKGYIADLAAEYLKKQGLDNFIINAGGDMRIMGAKFSEPFIVGIVDPAKPTQITEAIKIKNKGVATSGNYERSFKTKDGKLINHIFVGVTFEPVNNYASVSVVAPTAEEADALATIYFLSDNDTINSFCTKFDTPTLIIMTDYTKIPLCGWDKLVVK